jgi:hypothetical protein
MKKQRYTSEFKNEAVVILIDGVTVKAVVPATHQTLAL